VEKKQPELTIRSGLRSIAAALPVLPSWAASSTSSTSTIEPSRQSAAQPPQPRNASRLSGRSSSSSSSEGRSHTIQSPTESIKSTRSDSRRLLDSPIEDLLGEEEEDEVMKGGKVLTPRRTGPSLNRKEDDGRASASKLNTGRREASETGEESDGWGW